MLRFTQVLSRLNKNLLGVLFFFSLNNCIAQTSAAPSHRSGHYSEGFEVSFDLKSGQELVYTLNCENPILQGKKYTVPIFIGDLKDLPSSIDTIPTTPLEGPYQLDYFRWKEPQPRTDNLWILRYAILESDSLVYQSSLSYFIGANWSNSSMPIASLVTNPESLFSSSSGLFVPGNIYDSLGWGDDFFCQGNFSMKGKDWQRYGNFCMLDSGLANIYESPLDYRLHGAVVGVFPQKSIRFYTDKQPEGTPFPFEKVAGGDSLELSRFILRNSGSDFVSTHLRDAFLSEVANGMELSSQRSTPTTLYINGRYWGVYNLRERIDKYFMQSHFNVAKDEYEMLEGTGGEIIKGTNKHYIELLTMIFENDLSIDSNYQKALNYMDIDQYIDYTIFETFFGNLDWPGNNVKFWRPKNGKWQWIFFDGDVTMSPYVFNKDGGAEQNTLAGAVADSSTLWYNSPGSTFLLRNLMKSDQFYQKLSSRYEQLSQSHLSSENLHSTLNKLTRAYVGEMPDHIARWRYPPTIENWQEEIQMLHEFIEKRPEFFHSHLSNLPR